MTERVLHWSVAALVLALLATGAALYFGPLSTWVGRRHLLKTVHVLAGLALPVPFLVAYAGPWSRRLRADTRRLNRWDDGDRRWLRRDPRAPVGKFNAGQKLNAAFVAGALLLMFVTGLMLRWPDPYPDDWRTGATFVHDWVFVALVVSVVGHVSMAVGDRDALRSMRTGRVPEAWARRRRPAWEPEAPSGAPQEPTYDGAPSP